jgi:hypothetical protein
MTLREAFVMAVRGVRADRLRSQLTMLGIMIGLAAVILLVALGNGTSARLNAQIESLGTNLIGASRTVAASRKAGAASRSPTGTSRRSRRATGARRQPDPPAAGSSGQRRQRAAQQLRGVRAGISVAGHQVRGQRRRHLRPGHPCGRAHRCL